MMRDGTCGARAHGPIYGAEGDSPTPGRPETTEWSQPVLGSLSLSATDLETKCEGGLVCWDVGVGLDG